jgi:protein gp37
MSKIEWTDKTWNPIIGCSKVSPACDNCYAEKMAARLALMPNAPSEYANVVNNNGTWSGGTAFVESALEKPLHWRKPCRVFVGSMTDLFHPSTPREWIDKVFAIMALTPHITYQVLTKRPERMAEYCSNPNNRSLHEMERISGERLCCGGFWPLNNVWLGVTVENQEQADKRIPILLDTPAAVRFVSVEPMLEGINLNNGDMINGLDWVICGGETGPNARPMWEHWARALLEECEASGTPFFFKKWGSYKGRDDWKIPAGEKINGQIIREFPATFGG